MGKSTPTHTIKQGLSESILRVDTITMIQINPALLCVLVYFYPCLMTGGIIRYNFESRHYNDDSDKPCFIVCVGVLLPMFDDWWMGKSTPTHTINHSLSESSL
jgi:hypothetical protein